MATNADGNNINMSIDRHCNLMINEITTSTEFFNSSGVLAESLSFYSDVVLVTDSAFCGVARPTRMLISCRAGEHGLMQLDIERELVIADSRTHGLLGM